MSIEYITMGVNETYTKSGQRNETDVCGARIDSPARRPRRARGVLPDPAATPETRGARPPGGEAAPQKP